MVNPSRQLKPAQETTPLTSFASSVSDGDDEKSWRNSLHGFPTFRLYRERWLILFSYSLLNLSNGWIWATWSPLTSLLAEYWQVPVNFVDNLSGVYMYVFVPTNIASMWLVVNYLGLGRGLQIGAILNMMGALVISRGGGSMVNIMSSWNDYQITYLGVFLCALAQTFLLPMVALLSGNWFGETERATATSLGTMATQLGSLFGLGSTVLVDFRQETTGKLDTVKFDRYMQLHFAVALLALFLALVLLNKGKPPTPPSEAASAVTRNKDLSINYVGSIRMIMASPSSKTFFVLFGLVVGTFYAIPAFLSQFMPSWPPRSQGLLGVVFQVAAVLGCSSVGRIVSGWNLQYKKISLHLMTGCLISVALYLISVKYQSYLALLACGGMGFFFSSFMAVGIEFGTSLTFPADEAAVYGILDSTGELSGYLLVTLGGALSRYHLEVGYCGVLLVLVALSLALLWTLKPLIRRPSVMSSTSSIVWDDSETLA